MEFSPLQTLRPAALNALPGLTAGFSTRRGGVSVGPYASLNLGLSTDDARERVLENRRRLFTSVGFSMEQLALAGQVHGDQIEEVTEPGLTSGIDGLVTRQPGVLLCIGAADCAAVLLADAEVGVVGACHAGWRGAVQGIAEKIVARMAELGAQPVRMLAYVSPCIGVEQFEVGPEVAVQFDAPFVAHAARWEKPHVDLKAAVAAQLRGAGVPAEAVAVSSRCTMSAPEDFFSYRAAGGVTGRMMGFIGIAQGG